MDWSIIQVVLKKIGITGIESYDHFKEWLDYDCDDKQLERTFYNEYKKLTI